MLKLFVKNLLLCSVFIALLFGCNDSDNNTESDIGGSGDNPPTISMGCDPTHIDYNGDTTITWSTENAETCEASVDWSGDKATSGSETISELVSSSTFTLTCQNSEGVSATETVQVVVQGDGAGTATLSWIPPTTNADPENTPLTDLNGYIIYFGQADNKNEFSIKIFLDDEGLTEAPEGRVTYTVDGLAKGTWYFTVSAFNTSNSESERSNEANTDIELP